MKKLIVMLLAAALSFSLAGCDIETDEKEVIGRSEPAGIADLGAAGKTDPFGDNPAAVIIDDDDYGAIYEKILALQIAQGVRDFFSTGSSRANSAKASSNDDASSNDYGGMVGDAVARAESAPMPAVDEAEYSAEAPEAAMGGGESEDFSGTNNQVAGVEEGDIIKTDGKFIYYVSNANQSVNVVKVNSGEMELLSVIKRNNAYPAEMLLYEDKLIVIWYRNEDGSWYYRSETLVEVYDTNGSFNTPSASYTQDGWYTSSRMIDNNIYLITNHTPYIYREFREEDYDAYIPGYSVNDDARLVPAGCIALPENLNSVSYTLISGLDVNRTDILVSVQANLGSSYVIYSSPQNIYVTCTIYDYSNNYDWNYTCYTEITKFAFDNGQVTLAAKGKVEGSIDNQFYMDEHKGILRVFAQINDTQTWSPSANLYTLDENLNQLAFITGIGPDEFIQSARFMGDVGYVVTFRLTDPLYSFDLSDPHNPKILDELKIPGFSRYLHKWSDDLLLGVGVDANEETGMRTGLKLSMFDTQDNENLSELFVYVIPAGSNSWLYSPAEHTHKAVLASPEKNIIAFPYQRDFYSDNMYAVSYVYAVFSYDRQGGFTLEGEIKSEHIIDYNNYDYNYDYNYYKNQFQRGLYIGDYIYAASDNKLVSMSLNTFNIAGELMFG